MSERSIIERVEKLEQRVDRLETLPAQVAGIEAQLLQLRGEMQSGFSAIRGEMHTMGETLRADVLARIQAVDDDLRGEMHALHHLTIERIDAGDTETRRYMRVMVEEVLARIETIGEGRRTRKKR